jgi:hypothetical protein
VLILFFSNSKLQPVLAFGLLRKQKTRQGGQRTKLVFEVNRPSVELLSFTCLAFVELVFCIVLHLLDNVMTGF